MKTSIFTITESDINQPFTPDGFSWLKYEVVGGVNQEPCATDEFNSGEFFDALFKALCNPTASTIGATP